MVMSHKVANPANLPQNNLIMSRQTIYHGLLVPLVLGTIGCQEQLDFRSALRLVPEPESQSIESNLAPRTLDSEFEALLSRVERRVSRFVSDQSLLASGNAVPAAALERAVQIEVGQFRQADDSVRGLIDLWSYFRRLQDSLTNGADQAQFGSEQSRVVRMVDRNRQDVVDLATQVLDAERFVEIKTEISEHARQYPLASIVEQPDAQAFSAFDVGSMLVGQLVSLPGEAFERLNPTSGLSRAGNRFADVAEQWPAKARFELEALLEDLPDYPIVQRLLETTERLNTQVEQLQVTVSELPKNVSTESQAVLEQFGAQQPELQKTLAAADKTIASTRDTLAAAEQTTESLTRLTNALQETVRVTDQLVARFDQKPVDPKVQPPAALDDPPTAFDIREYQSAAEALTETSRELRALLGDVQALIAQVQAPESELRLQQQLDAALQNTDGRLRGVVDHAAWRVAQLCGLVFILVVAYRLLSWLFGRAPQERTSR